MSKVGKILFHRIAIIGTFIVLQVFLYVLLILKFSEYMLYFNWLCIGISIAAVLWIVNDRSNPGYKLGWIIIVLIAPVVGGLLYLLLGGNRLSRRNQRRLRVMQYKMEIPSRMRPDPRQLNIRYRMAERMERPLSRAATAMQAVTAAISTKT